MMPRSAICFMMGIPNSPAHRYLQVKRARVENNSIVNCKHSLLIGLSDDKNATLPPVETVIRGNRILSPKTVRLWKPVAALTVSPGAIISSRENRWGFQRVRRGQYIEYCRSENRRNLQTNRFDEIKSGANWWRVCSHSTSLND